MNEFILSRRKKQAEFTERSNTIRFGLQPAELQTDLGFRIDNDPSHA
jgi:hypothetical protein